MSASGEGGGVLEADATRDHAALLASIVEFSDDAILAKGLDGRILSWNRGAERLFGYSAAEMLGESILRLVPNELHGDEEYIVAQLRSGQSIHHFETERLHRSGCRIAVSLTVSPIRDREGRVVGASKTLRDISERKRIDADRGAAGDGGHLGGDCAVSCARNRRPGAFASRRPGHVPGEAGFARVSDVFSRPEPRE